MNLDLTLRGETRSFPLKHGLYRIGGHAHDDFKVQGMPHRIATVRVEGERVLVTAALNLRVGSMVLTARTPHQLHLNEAVCLDNGLTLRLRGASAEAPSGRMTRTVQSIRGLLSLLGGRKVSASLTCIAGQDVGTSFLLARRSAVIGRGLEAEVQLKDRAVSRRHMRVLRESDGFHLEVMPSTNPVYVNGKKVAAAKVALNAGDVLEIGTTLLRFGLLEAQATLRGRLDRTIAEPNPHGFFANLDDIATQQRRQKPRAAAKAAWFDRSDWPYVAVGASLAAVACASTYALLHYLN